MHGGKLFDWLSVFDAHQLQRLRKFVRSPYFNEHLDVVGLLDILMAGTWEKQAVWASLHPQLPYNDLRLRHLCSLLLGLCERFAAVQRFESQPVAVQVECLSALRERGKPGLRGFTARKFARQNESLPPPASLDDFLHRFRLEAEQHETAQDEDQRRGATLLQPVLDHLDGYYHLAKLKYACALLNNQRVVDVQAHNAMMPDILRALEDSPQPLPVLLDLYLHLLTMLRDPAQMPSYERLRLLLDLHGHALPDHEAGDLYTLTMNHCIGRINAGQQRFLHELFGLYKAALERGFLFPNGFLSPWNYKNITVTGLRLGEFAWVEAFIHSHKGRLAPEHRANAFTYNLARLHFHRRQYPEAQRLLQQIAYDDVFYSLDSKVMLLKIYYESTEFQALDALIDSFRSLLRRNRLISDQHRLNYLNLIKFVRKLSRMAPGDLKRLAQIRREVEACVQVADLGWLMEKMEE